MSDRQERKQRQRRRRRSQGRNPAEEHELNLARRTVRQRPRSEVWAWMRGRSIAGQTIPVPLLVACCEYVGERAGGTDATFVRLRDEVREATGRDMPVVSTRREV